MNKFYSNLQFFLHLPKLNFFFIHLDSSPSRTQIKMVKNISNSFFFFLLFKIRAAHWNAFTTAMRALGFSRPEVFPYLFLSKLQLYSGNSIYRTSMFFYTYRFVQNSHFPVLYVLWVLQLFSSFFFYFLFYFLTFGLIYPVYKLSKLLASNLEIQIVKNIEFKIRFEKDKPANFSDFLYSIRFSFYFKTLTFFYKIEHFITFLTNNIYTFYFAVPKTTISFSTFTLGTHFCSFFSLFQLQLFKTHQLNYFKLFLTLPKFYSNQSLSNALNLLSSTHSKFFSNDFLFSIFSRPYFLNFFFPVFSSMFFDPKLYNLEYDIVKPIFFRRSFSDDQDETTTFMPNYANIFTRAKHYNRTRRPTPEDSLVKQFRPDISNPLWYFEKGLGSEYFKSDFHELSYQNYFLHFYGSYNIEFFFYLYLFPFITRKKAFTLPTSFLFLTFFFKNVDFVRNPPRFFFSIKSFTNFYLFYFQKSIFSFPRFSFWKNKKILNVNFYFIKLKKNFSSFFFAYFKFLNQTSALQDLEYYSTYDRSFDFTQSTTQEFPDSEQLLSVVDDEDSDPDYESLYFSLFDEDEFEDTFDDNLLGNSSVPLFEHYVFNDDFVTQPFIVDDAIAETLIYPISPEYIYDEVFKSLEQLSFETNELDIDEILFQNIYISNLEKIVENFFASSKFYDPILDFDLHTDGKFNDSLVNPSGDSAEGSGGESDHNSDESDSRIDDDDFFRHPTDQKTFLIIKNYTQSYNDLNTKWLTLNKSFNLKPLPPFLYGVGKYLPRFSKTSFVNEVDLVLKKNNFDSSFFSYFSSSSSISNFFKPYYNNETEFLKTFFYVFQSPSYLYPNDKYLTLFLIFNNLQKNFNLTFANQSDLRLKTSKYSPYFIAIYHSFFFFRWAEPIEDEFPFRTDFPTLAIDPWSSFNKPHKNFIDRVERYYSEFRGLSFFAAVKIIVKRFFLYFQKTRKPETLTNLQLQANRYEAFVPRFSTEQSVYFRVKKFNIPKGERRKRFQDFFPKQSHVFRSFFISGRSNNAYYRILNWRFPFYSSKADDQNFLSFKHKSGELANVYHRYLQKAIQPKIIFNFFRQYSKRKTFYHGKNRDLEDYILKDSKETPLEYRFYSRKYFFELGWFFKQNVRNDEYRKIQFPKPYSRYKNAIIYNVKHIFKSFKKKRRFSKYRKYFIASDPMLSVAFSILSSFASSISELSFLHHSLLKTIIPRSYKLKSNFYKTFSFYDRPRYKIFDVYTLNYRLEQKVLTRKYRKTQIHVIAKTVVDLASPTKKKLTDKEIKLEELQAYFENRKPREEKLVKRKKEPFQNNSDKSSQRVPFYKISNFSFLSFKKFFKPMLFDHEFIDLFYTQYDNPYLNFFLPVKSFSFYRLFDNWLFPYQYTFPVGNYFFDYFIFTQNDFQTDFNIFDIYMQTHPTELIGYFEDDTNEDEIDDDYFISSSSYDSISKTEFELNHSDGTSEDPSLGLIIQKDDTDDLNYEYFAEDLDDEISPEDEFIDADDINPFYLYFKQGVPDVSENGFNTAEEYVNTEDYYNDGSLDYDYIDIFDDSNESNSDEFSPIYLVSPPPSEDEINFISSFFVNHFNEFEINPTRSFPASTSLYYNRLKTNPSANRRKQIFFRTLRGMVDPTPEFDKGKPDTFRFYNFRKSLYYKRYRHFRFIGNHKSSQNRSVFSYSPFYNYFDINLQFFNDTESETDFEAEEVSSELENELFNYTNSDLNEFLDQENDDLDPDFFDFSTYTSVPFSRFFFGYSKSNASPYAVSDFRYQAGFDLFGSFEKPFNKTSTSLTVVNNSSKLDQPIIASTFSVLSKFFFRPCFIYLYKFSRFFLLWFQHSYYFSKPEFFFATTWSHHYSHYSHVYSSYNFSKYFEFVKVWNLGLSHLSISTIRATYFKNLFNPLYYPLNKNGVEQSLENFFRYETDSEYLNLEFFFESELYTRTLHNFELNSNVTLPVFFWNYDEYFLYSLNTFDHHNFESAFDFLDGGSYTWPSRETVNADSPDETLDLAPIYEEMILNESNFYYSRLEIFFAALNESLLIFVQFFSGFIQTFKSKLMTFTTSILIYWELGWLKLHLDYGYVATLTRSVLSISFFVVVSIYTLFIIPYVIFFFFPFLSYFYFFSIFSLSVFVMAFFFSFICFKSFRFFYASLTKDEFFVIYAMCIGLWFQNVYFGYNANPYILQNFFSNEPFDRLEYERVFNNTYFSQTKFKRPSNSLFSAYQNSFHSDNTDAGQEFNRLELTRSLYEYTGPRYPVLSSLKNFSTPSFPHSHDPVTFTPETFPKKFYPIQLDSSVDINSKKEYIFRLRTLSSAVENLEPLVSINQFEHQGHLASATFNYKNFFDFVFDDLFDYRFRDDDYIYQPYRSIKRSHRINRKLIQIYRDWSISYRVTRKQHRPNQFITIENDVRAFFFTPYFRKRPHKFQFYHRYKYKQTHGIYKMYRASVFASVINELVGSSFYDKELYRYRPKNVYLKFQHTLLGKPYSTDRFSVVRPFFPNYFVGSPAKSYFFNDLGVYDPFKKFPHKVFNTFFSGFSTKSNVFNFYSITPFEPFSFAQNFYPTSVDLRFKKPYWNQNQKYGNFDSTLNSFSSNSTSSQNLIQATTNDYINAYSDARRVFQKRFSSDFFFYSSFRKGATSVSQNSRFEVLRRFRFNISKLEKNFDSHNLFPSHYKFSSFNTGFSMLPFRSLYNQHFFYNRSSYNLFTVLDIRPHNFQFTTYASRFLYNNVQNSRAKLNFNSFSTRYSRSYNYRKKFDQYHSIFKGGSGSTNYYTFYKVRAFIFGFEPQSIREHYSNVAADSYFPYFSTLERSTYPLQQPVSSSEFQNLERSFLGFQSKNYFNRQLYFNTYYPNVLVNNSTKKFSDFSIDSTFSKKLRDIAVFRLSFIKFVEARKKFLNNYTSNHVLPIYSSSNYISSILFSLLVNPLFVSKPKTSFLVNDLNYFADFSGASGNITFVNSNSPFFNSNYSTLPDSSMFVLNNRLDSFFSNAHLFSFSNRDFIAIQQYWLDDGIKGFSFTNHYDDLSQRSKKTISHKIFYATLANYFQSLDLQDESFFLNRFQKHILFSGRYKRNKIKKPFLKHSNQYFRKFGEKPVYVNYPFDDLKSAVTYFQFKRYSRRQLFELDAFSNCYPFINQTFNIESFQTRYPSYYFSDLNLSEVDFKDSTSLSHNMKRHTFNRKLRRPSMFVDPFFEGNHASRPNFASRQYIFLSRFVNVNILF